MPETTPRRPPKPKVPNPIAAAVQAWLVEQNVPAASHEALVAAAPKRWVVYEPLVLLPSGSFASGPWPTLLDGGVDATQVALLWEGIVRAITRASGGTSPLTHLAVNEGIPLHIPAQPAEGSSPGSASAINSEPTPENVLRSPGGLRMLHGDFGPASRGATDPTEADFAAAFWVATKQNGIQQAWAPRWTMFSRGNVKEKARLLTFGGTPSKNDEARRYAVDLYGGIGYFVFSYARRGLRVLAWELNPWSVEGLRRGAVANKWSVKVVQGAELARPTAEVVAGGEQIVVFLEDNRAALARISALRNARLGVDIAHVNCGFLPSSIGTWRPAWDMLQVRGAHGWLHLHENVAIADIEVRRIQMQGMLDAWARETPEPGMRGRVEHVELVKTFAPDVWHCVFDVSIAHA